MCFFYRFCSNPIPGLKFTNQGIVCFFYKDLGNRDSNIMISYPDDIAYNIVFKKETCSVMSLRDIQWT